MAPVYSALGTQMTTIVHRGEHVRDITSLRNRGQKAQLGKDRNFSRRKGSEIPNMDSLKDYPQTTVYNICTQYFILEFT